MTRSQIRGDHARTFRFGSSEVPLLYIALLVVRKMFQVKYFQDITNVILEVVYQGKTLSSCFQGRPMKILTTPSRPPSCIIK